MSSSTITKTTAAAAAALQCRTCRMTPPRRDQAVPVEAMLDYHGKSVADMIYELTTIAVTVDQDLPQWICVGCAEDLRSAYSFRQRCIDSNEAFLNEMSTDEMVTPCGTPPAIDPLMLKTEPCDLELMEMMTEETNETHGDGEDEYQESRVTSPETSCDLGNSSHKQRKQRGCSKKGFSFSEIAVHYIKERDGKHWCIIDPISRCTYAQPILAMGNFIRHFRLKHPEVAARKGFVPGVPPEEMPDMMDTAEQDVEPILPVVASRQSKKMVSRSTAPVWKFIEKYDDMYHCAIDPDSYCSYAKKQRNLTDFLRHFRAVHPKAAVARNLYPIKKPPMVKMAAMQQLKKEPKQADAAVAAEEVEAVVHPSRQHSASETKYNAIAIKYIKHSDGKYWCVIDPNSDCRYAQCRYDAGNFVRHFRTIHPLEAVEKNLVRQEKHIMLPPDERKRLAKKPFINADPALVLEACIKLMAVHGFPAQCFGWTGMRIFMMPLVKLFNVEISNASIAQHTHLAAETMVRTLQTEMKRKLISIHIELVAQSRQHFLTVSASYNFNHRTVTRVLGLIRVTEATPTRQLKADLLDLLARYELSSKQIAVIVLSNAGSVFSMPKKLQKIFVESMVKPSFEYSAPDKEETLMRALAAELKGEFEVVCNVVGTLLSALNDFLPDTDPTVVRIASFLTNLRSAQYKEFFTENQASQPPVWHPKRWLRKFKAIRSLIKQEPFFVELAQRHPELALDESDWQYLREYHYALLPLYTFIKGLEQAQFHIPFSTFYLNCLAVVKNVRGMVNRFSKPVSAALGKRLMELRDLNVFRVVLYLDPRFQYYSTAMLNAEQQSGAQVC
nr:uncharacterized protein LOC115253713 [Aedes albopictus]